MIWTWATGEGWRGRVWICISALSAIFQQCILGRAVLCSRRRRRFGRRGLLELLLVPSVLALFSFSMLEFPLPLIAAS